MQFLRLLIFIFLFVFNDNVKANMRRCLLLPIQDSVGGAVGFKVFEGIEKFLKDGDWCYYRSNSPILDILSDHKKNLDSYLENEDVLRLIAQKTRSGALIRVKLKYVAKGIEVSIRIFGANGTDVYLNEKSLLAKDDVDVLIQTVKNWLGTYEQKIPYDGLIIGVLGGQFTVDVGRSSGFFSNNNVEVKRVLGKRKHPLLREIVDWETEEIGSGKIFHANINQSQGQIAEYYTNKKLKVGDWVMLKNKNKIGKIEKRKYDGSQYSFGKLGQMGIFVNLGSGESTVNTATMKRGVGGQTLGFDLMMELWMTRKYWAGLDISRKYGTLKRKSGTLTNDRNSTNISKLRARVAYKYLPLGFFYGPQVDAFLGYASYKYGLETRVADGFTEFSVSGLLLGMRGTVPIQRMFHSYIELGFLVGADFEEYTRIHGGGDSASNYYLDFGATYMYSPRVKIGGGYELVSNKIKFTSLSRDLELADSSLKFGATFTY